MSLKISILIFTDIPSPYQVELFNAIVDHNLLDMTIAYISKKSPDRHWKQPNLNHNHIVLDNNIERYTEVGILMDSIDLVIFNYYRHPQVIKLINHRADSQKSWCFWGERIGYHQLGWLGTYYRKWKLSALHQSNVPIWGIGNWAVEEYKKEFGKERQYFNFPYFSELKHYNCYKDQTWFENQPRRFLFSGSLIYRKGIDLLASAFCQLANEFSNIQLKIMGDGKMRLWLENKLLKYNDRVEFIGFQSWEDLPKFYHQVDILCVPSRYDGWGLVVPEGLAAGLPVIATNRTGAALDLIKPGENGWLIPPGDRKSLYEAMKQSILLSDAELLSYSHQAQKSICHHSLKDGVDRFHLYVRETMDVFK